MKTPPVLKSDQNPHYPKDVRTYLPAATHIAYKGIKPASDGQGELKEGGKALHEYCADGAFS